MPGVTGALPPVNKSKDTDRSGRLWEIFTQPSNYYFFHFFLGFVAIMQAAAKIPFVIKFFFHCQQRITRLIELLNLFLNEKNSSHKNYV